MERYQIWNHPAFSGYSHNTGSSVLSEFIQHWYKTMVWAGIWLMILHKWVRLVSVFKYTTLGHEPVLCGPTPDKKLQKKLTIGIFLPTTKASSPVIKGLSNPVVHLCLICFIFRRVMTTSPNKEPMTEMMDVRFLWTLKSFRLVSQNVWSIIKMHRILIRQRRNRCQCQLMHEHKWCLLRHVVHLWQRIMLDWFWV